MKPVDARSWGSPPSPSHRRVVAGPVQEEVRCKSLRQFKARVPRASAEQLEDARGFFEVGPGELVVVPREEAPVGEG